MLEPDGHDFTISGLLSRQCNFRVWNNLLLVQIPPHAYAMRNICCWIKIFSFHAAYAILLIFKCDTHRVTHFIAAITLFISVALIIHELEPTAFKFNALQVMLCMFL